MQLKDATNMEVRHSSKKTDRFRFGNLLRRFDNHREGLRQFLSSMRFKLTAFISILILVLVFIVHASVSNIMEKELLASMLGKGEAITQTILGQAGFNILGKNDLALDNLVSKIDTSQQDLSYLAIIDRDGKVLAHTDIERRGDPVAESRGKLIYQKDGMSVREIEEGNLSRLEYRAPIVFSDTRVGEVVAGFETTSLYKNISFVLKKISWVAMITLGLGILGTLFLSRYFVTPIRNLEAAISHVRLGEVHSDIPVTSKDEIGTLTHNFNNMAKIVSVQREKLIHYSEDLEAAYSDIVRTLAGSLDARDEYTHGHSQRVAEFATALGERYGLPDEELTLLRTACLLHDIGKINIPDSILRKDGPLNDDEYVQIKRHPIVGAEMLQLSHSLHQYIPIVLQHHECYDGSGYPHGLKGEEISLHARIVALADCYDALISSRPYRSGCSRDAAILEIEGYKGRQFDPGLADLFVELLCDGYMSCEIALAGGST